MAQANKDSLSQWIFAYLLWFGVVLITMVIILILHSVLELLLLTLLLHPRVVWAIQEFAICFAGIPWIVIIFFVEGYFRKGLFQGELWKRVKTVYMYLGIALGIALLALGSVEIYVRL